MHCVMLKRFIFRIWKFIAENNKIVHMSYACFDVVKRFFGPLENSNRNLAADDYYTNVPLAHYLLGKKLH